MTRARLEKRRILVVGASAGIGRATSLALAREGARVALASRRRELLNETVTLAGPACQGFECDVRDPSACEHLVNQASEALGGLDAVVYAPGITLLAKIEESDSDLWRTTFETNLFGAALITRAALPHLVRSRGKVVFFSSISIDDRPPRAGMAAYVASKVALESMALAWQGEHPTVSFTTLAIGDTLTEKVETTPTEAVAEWVPRWIAAGLMPGRLMLAESVADQVTNILASPEHVRRLAITPVAPEIPGVMEIPGVGE